MSPVLTPRACCRLSLKTTSCSGRRLVGQLVIAFELLADVVGVEHRVFGGLAQAVRAVGEDIGQGADEHAEVAVEHADAANGLRPVVVEAERAVGVLRDDGRGKKWLQDFFARHRPGARTAAAVRRGEGLVQVQVHDVDAEIAGARLAAERIHVGAIHVEQARPWRAGRRRSCGSRSRTRRWSKGW